MIEYCSLKFRKRELPLIWIISKEWFFNVFEDCANELGVSVDDLTVEQKQDAVLNRTLEEGQKLIDMYDKQGDNK